MLHAVAASCKYQRGRERRSCPRRSPAAGPALLHIAAKGGRAQQRSRASPGHVVCGPRSCSLAMQSFILDSGHLQHHIAILTNGASRQQWGVTPAAAADEGGGGGGGAAAYTGMVRRAHDILTPPPRPFTVGRLLHNKIAMAGAMAGATGCERGASEYFWCSGAGGRVDRRGGD